MLCLKRNWIRTMSNAALFLSFLFMVHVRAIKQHTVEDVLTITGRRVNLTCSFKSPAGNVSWRIKLGNSFDEIFSCHSNENIPCTSQEAADDPFLGEFEFHATQDKVSSFLSFSPVGDRSFQCVSGNVVMEYRTISINTNDITPYCNIILPILSSSGELQMEISCGFNFSRALPAIVTLDGTGYDFSEVFNSSQSVNTFILPFDNFKNISNASCTSYFPGTDIMKSCIYPTIVKTQYKYIAEENDVIVKCQEHSDVDWSLFDRKGIEEDIKNRSWTREGGQSLLIRKVSKQDKGKVVVCRTKGGNLSDGTIVFAIISDNTGDGNELDPKLVNNNNNNNNNDNDPFFVPTLLFLALWLITTSVFGVWFLCKDKPKKSINSASRNVSVFNARVNQSSDVEQNVAGGAGDRETPLVLTRTEGRRDPDTSNTNNSANNPTSELEEDGSDQNNRQSNNGSHLYFTLEKPSPSTESSRMTTTSGIDRREDTNLASLNQPQRSHWQGYEAVGESDKGACSYDFGEYAEVGDHLIGRSLTDRSVRPSIPKKPGKEEIKENDISKLYSQVNK